MEVSSCTGRLTGKQTGCGALQHLNRPATLSHKPNKHTNKGENASSVHDLYLLHSVVHAQLSTAQRACLQVQFLTLINWNSHFYHCNITSGRVSKEQLVHLRPAQSRHRMLGQPPWRRCAWNKHANTLKIQRTCVTLTLRLASAVLKPHCLQLSGKKKRKRGKNPTTLRQTVILRLKYSITAVWLLAFIVCHVTAVSCSVAITTTCIKGGLTAVEKELTVRTSTVE